MYSPYLSFCNKQHKKEEDEGEETEGSVTTDYDDDTLPEGLLRDPSGCYGWLERLVTRDPLRSSTDPPEATVYYDDTRLEAQEEWRRQAPGSS